MEANKEKLLTDRPEPISLEAIEKIVDQMKKNICKIYLRDGNKGTGFFYKIPFPDNKNLLPILITANHLIDEKLLKSKNEYMMISIDNDESFVKIEFENRINYTNKEYDVTIIEIKENEDKIYNFFYFDDYINNKDLNINYIYNKRTIYTLHYPNSNYAVVSFGLFKDIPFDKDYYFNNSCSTINGSSGGPILDLKNNKVIGMHIDSTIYNYNTAIFLNYPIKDFLNVKFNKTTLKLIKKTFKEKELEFFKICNFSEIKELNLNNNNLDIKILEDIKFEKLEILNLNNNQISDITILEKINLKYLKELHLEANNISNIDSLKKINCEKLEKLYLGSNKISNIDALKKVKFKELKE